MKIFNTLNPRPGDSNHTLIEKMIQKMGGSPKWGDNLVELLKKILTALGGTPIPGDTVNSLLAKILNKVSPSPLVISEAFASRSGISDPVQIAAITALITNAMAHGWWDKCDLIYPFVGGTANAHAQNLKSPSFPIVWAGTVTHNANGVAGNGTTGYANTGYAPETSGNMQQDSTHVGLYRRIRGNTSAAYFGCSQSGKELGATNFPLDNGNVAFAINDAVSTNGAIGSSLGFCIFARNDAATKHLFTGGLDKSTNQVSTGLPIAPKTLLILCGSNNGTPNNFSTVNLAGFTAGPGITFAESTAMVADWQAFATALNRQV